MAAGGPSTLWVRAGCLFLLGGVAACTPKPTLVPPAQTSAAAGTASGDAQRPGGGVQGAGGRARGLCLTQDMEGTWLRATGSPEAPDRIEVGVPCPDIQHCPAGQGCHALDDAIRVEYATGSTTSGQVLTEQWFIDERDNQTTRIDATFPGSRVRELVLPTNLRAGCPGSCPSNCLPVVAAR